MQLPDGISARWVTYDPAQAEAWTAMLSGEEHARMQTFAHAGRRREFITGRAAVRTLLGEALGCPPSEVSVAIDRHGALDVPGTDHYVSLAHSGPHAVAVAGPHPVGIDLERIAPRRPDLDRFILHPDEHDLFDQLPLDRDRSLILVWTLKEATLKGLRTGFRLSPKKIRLAVDVPSGSARATVKDDQAWEAHFGEREGYFWAVASPD